MSKKSQMFLGLAGFAMLMSLVFKFAFATPAIDLADFAIGLGAALMLGVLLNWQKNDAPAK